MLPDVSGLHVDRVGEHSYLSGLGSVKMRPTLDLVHLRSYTSLYRRLIRLVQEDWSSLTEGERDYLKALAYLSLEPPGGISSILGRIAGAFAIAVLWFRGDLHDLTEFLSVENRFAEAVMDAVERHDPQFQKLLEDAIGSGLEASEKTIRSSA